MEKHLQNTFEICLKTMRGDTVKIHIKCDGKMNSIDEAETHMSCTVGEMKHVDEAETHRREKTLGELERNVQKMYKCEDCSYSTIWSSNLRKHEKAMHNDSEEQKMYKCLY